MSPDPWFPVRLLVASFACAAALPAQAATVLVGATVFDGTGGPPISDAAIRIADGRVVCLGPRDHCVPATGDEVVELTGQFITPGLVDSHVHFSQTGEHQIRD